LLKFCKILLAFNTTILALKYILLKYFVSFKTFIAFGKLEIKLVKKSLSINEIVKLSNRVFKILKIKSCLIKSMTLKELLCNQGFDSRLIIGIKNDKEKFESHCWLEIQNNLFTHNKDISKFKVITKI
jgi:hypothetical protein